MIKYYTRACNFHYGKYSKFLINKKLALPLCGNKHISFDKIEIITRNSKKKIFINQTKYLPKLIRKKINFDLKKIKSKKKKFLKFRFQKNTKYSRSIKLNT